MGILKPRTASFLVFQGDDMGRLAELRRAAEVATRQAEIAARGPRRGGDPIPTATEEQEAFDTFVDEAAERAVEVTVQAIGSKRFRDLLAAHPPRTEVVDGKEVVVEDDRDYAVNTETLPMALLTYRDPGNPERRTIVEPDLSEADLREFLEDDCADGDFEKGWETAFWLNRGEGADPRLGKYSTGTPDSP